MRVALRGQRLLNTSAYLSYLGLYGSAMKQGNSIHREEDIGQRRSRQNHGDRRP